MKKSTSFFSNIFVNLRKPESFVVDVFLTLPLIDWTATYF